MAEKEYIERDAVLDLLTNRDVVINPNDEVANIREDVECLPAADVKPVVRGHWVMDSDGLPVCSECGAIALQRLHMHFRTMITEVKLVTSKFCPECGADLREKKNG